MRSNIQRLREIRDRIFPGYKKDPPQERDVFDLLIAVEQLQHYVTEDLDQKLLRHDMITTKGTIKIIKHCCCEREHHER